MREVVGSLNRSREDFINMRFNQNILKMRKRFDQGLGLFQMERHSTEAPALIVSFHLKATMLYLSNQSVCRSDR
jgi:hypothetical protein